MANGISMEVVVAVSIVIVLMVGATFILYIAIDDPDFHETTHHHSLRNICGGKTT